MLSGRSQMQKKKMYPTLLHLNEILEWINLPVVKKKKITQ